MPSAAFTINGSSERAVAVTAGSTVTLALASSLGADVVIWSVIGSHSSGATNPTITPSGSPAGATATFPMPSGNGQAYRIQCQINGGTENKQTVSAYTYTAIVGVAGTNGNMPLAAGEDYERSATHGYTETLNASLTAAASTVASSSEITTVDGTNQTIATIATSSERQYLVSAMVSSRQDASSNSSFQHARYLFTNKAGTLAAQGSGDLDALSYDAITMSGLSLTTSGTDIVVRLAGAVATTVRHDYLVEYVAMRIATS